MNYQRDPASTPTSGDGAGASSITQPPMYGHAVAELHPTTVWRFLSRSSIGPSRACGSCSRTAARHASGLVELAHPWESGCRRQPSLGLGLSGRVGPSTLEGPQEPVGRNDRAVGCGIPCRQPGVRGGIGRFHVLVAFNGRELGGGDRFDRVASRSDELAAALDARWDEGRRTWVDAGPTESGSGGVRSLDGLLPLLVTGRNDAAELVVAELIDPGGPAGAACGPAGVHRGEAVYEPTTYWRGPAWPQLSYLLWVGAVEAWRGARGRPRQRVVPGRGSQRSGRVLACRLRGRPRGHPPVVGGRGHLGRRTRLDIPRADSGAGFLVPFSGSGWRIAVEDVTDTRDPNVPLLAGGRLGGAAPNPPLQPTSGPGPRVEGDETEPPVGPAGHEHRVGRGVRLSTAGRGAGGEGAGALGVGKGAGRVVGTSGTDPVRTLDRCEPMRDGAGAGFVGWRGRRPPPLGHIIDTTNAATPASASAIAGPSTDRRSAPISVARITA